MLLRDVVATSQAVAATSKRTEKTAAIAELLRRCAPDEIPVVVGFLTGEARQGRIGVGWASAYRVDVAPSDAAIVEVLDVDRALTTLASTSGAGSQASRAAVLASLMERCTVDEQAFLRRLLTGEMRQGALDGVMADAIAKAAQVPAPSVRRAAMLAGDLGVAATLAMSGGVEALQALGLQTMRPVLPMLASPGATVADAAGDGSTPVAIEWKLDGARIQVHRLGDDVRVFTRNLNDVTTRLPHVVHAVRALDVNDVVLDGEALGVGTDDRPVRFQDGMSEFGSDGPSTSLRGFFFDVLALGGTSLIDEPLAMRRDALTTMRGLDVVPSLVTSDLAAAQAFTDEALAAGHEGVVVKDLHAPYDAGRRGAAWRKVKPVRTLDLVVLAAEWGHGRRTGWLSNLHLGARGAPGEFVMVGKTFKGLTDALLTWQTEQLLSREIGRDGIVVHVRPELVVEIALDGVQVSRRYPGGVALRFARVKRYREDKSAADADAIETVQALL
jgi:DNA ligase 1